MDGGMVGWMNGIGICSGWLHRNPNGGTDGWCINESEV